MLRSGPYALAMARPDFVLTVALDTGPMYGAVTGVGRSVIEFVAEFQSRPQDITVLPYALSFRAPLRPGTRRLTYPASMAMRSWGRWNFPAVNRSLRPAQLIHGTNFVVPPSRLPRLATVHDCWALRHPDQCTPVVNRAMNVLRRAVSSGAHVHTPSRATADAVSEIFPRAAVTVVPWAAPRQSSTDHRPPALARWAPNTPVIASIGTLDHRKNLVRLIAAFASLATDFPDLLLALAGAPGNAMPAIEQAINELPVELRKRVVLLGGVDHDQAMWLYRNCSALAYPSLDEGFGFPLLEAMTAGVPIVAANTGSLPEIADDAALLVDPLDTEALAHGLSIALSDSGRRQELIAAGTARLSHFSWPATADGLLNLYRSIVETSTNPTQRRNRTGRMNQ